MSGTLDCALKTDGQVGQTIGSLDGESPGNGMRPPDWQIYSGPGPTLATCASLWNWRCRRLLGEGERCRCRTYALVSGVPEAHSLLPSVAASGPPADDAPKSFTCSTLVLSEPEIRDPDTVSGSLCCGPSRLDGPARGLERHCGKKPGFSCPRACRRAR